MLSKYGKRSCILLNYDISDILLDQVVEYLDDPNFGTDYTKIDFVQNCIDALLDNKNGCDSIIEAASQTLKEAGKK